MSRLTRIALVVGASALAAWASRLVTIEYVSEDGPARWLAPVFEDSTLLNVDHAPVATREELLERIRSRRDEFEVLPPSGHTRYQHGQTQGGLSGYGDPVNIELTYIESDPHAVGVHITAADATGGFITSREDIINGLAGEEPTPGSVLAHRHAEAGDTFVFHVHVHEGLYRSVSLSASVLETFIAATNALVPIGEETVDWGREARHLGLDPSQLRDGLA